MVDLAFITDTNHDATAILDHATDKLTVTGDNGSVVLQLDFGTDYSGITFQAVPDAAGTGTDVSAVVCFCETTQRQMTPQRSEAVKAVFSEALDLPESERAAFLARSLDDAAERAEVERLLGWYSEDYLAEPAIKVEGIRPGADPATREPEQFGPYTIVRELGRGGMGTVYLAERHDDLAGYAVALKVIPAGAEPSGLEARLRTEIRVLSKLKHPDIVAVLDAGTTTHGRVYLSMEYVEGRALDVFARERSWILARGCGCS